MKFLDKFIDFITYQWKKKVVVLLASIFLWYYVSILAETEHNIAIPIEFNDLPNNLIVLHRSERNASFVVRGQINDINREEIYSSIKPVINLSNAAIGEYDYRVSFSVDNPKLRIQVNLLTETVKLKIDRLINKSVKVNPIITGVPEKGYYIGEYYLDRKYVIISGPESYIVSMTNIDTQKINVDNATNDIIEVVQFDLTNNTRVIGDSKVTIVIKVLPVSPEDTNSINTNHILTNESDLDFIYHAL